MSKMRIPMTFLTQEIPSIKGEEVKESNSKDKLDPGRDLGELKTKFFCLRCIN